MRRNDTARSGHDNLVASNELFQLLLPAFAILFAEIAGGVQNDAAGVDLALILRKSVLQILHAADIILAAVLLRDAHRAVLHDDGGLDVQKIRAQQRDARTATALVQEFQLTEQKAADVLVDQVGSHLGDTIA